MGEELPDFDDGKDEGALRTIGEVGRAFGLKPHVLRYWERQFPQLAPLKRSGNRRLYRSEDVELVARIDRLVNREGFTLRGARARIEKGGADAAPTATQAPPPANDELIAELGQIRDRLAAALGR